jgi:hypothetical protein
MHRRGVRRIFAVWAKKHRVCEWSTESGSWRPLDAAGAQIEDSCLVAPLRVAALLDAAEADNSVIEALAAKGNPALQEREAAAEVRGEARGVAQAILGFLEARGRRERDTATGDPPSEPPRSGSHMDFCCFHMKRRRERALSSLFIWTPQIFI